MQTQFSVEGANCVRCMSDATEALLERPRVTSVQTSAIPGCIVIDHDDDDVATLQAVIDRLLHGFDTASNGEVVMTSTSTTELPSCPHHPPARADERPTHCIGD